MVELDKTLIPTVAEPNVGNNVVSRVDNDTEVDRSNHNLSSHQISVFSESNTRSAVGKIRDEAEPKRFSVRSFAVERTESSVNVVCLDSAIAHFILLVFSKSFVSGDLHVIIDACTCVERGCRCSINQSELVCSLNIVEVERVNQVRTRRYGQSVNGSDRRLRIRLRKSLIIVVAGYEAKCEDRH